MSKSLIKKLTKPLEEEAICATSLKCISPTYEIQPICQPMPAVTALPSQASKSQADSLDSASHLSVSLNLQPSPHVSVSHGINTFLLSTLWHLVMGCLASVMAASLSQPDTPSDYKFASMLEKSEPWQHLPRAAAIGKVVMLRSPCQAQGGRQQGGGPRIESLWPWWRNEDALYRWESMGGSFLNARGRTASIDLPFFLSR
eukprot:1159527-Pelagomonas_calceolata.AAC.7